MGARGRGKISYAVQEIYEAIFEAYTVSLVIQGVPIYRRLSANPLTTGTTRKIIGRFQSKEVTRIRVFRKVGKAFWNGFHRIEIWVF